MLIVLLIGLALSYHWPEPMVDQERADADTEPRMPRPIGPLICTGDVGVSGY